MKTRKTNASEKMYQTKLCDMPGCELEAGTHIAGLLKEHGYMQSPRTDINEMNAWDMTLEQLEDFLGETLTTPSLIEAHTNHNGITYYSTTDDNGQKIYSFTDNFEDIWDQETEDAYTVKAAASAMGRSRSEKKAAAVRENGKLGGRPAKPATAMLIRNAEGGWSLCRWKGDIIPSEDFATQAQAREFAASKNWGVKRIPECDGGQWKSATSVRETFCILSGEGSRGRSEVVNLTLTGLKRRLTRERCNGDRWARAYYGETTDGQPVDA